MTKRALILIDIQNDYFPGGLWPVHQMEQAANTAAGVLAQARQDGDTVIHIRHEIASNGAPFFQPGSDGALIHPSVAPVGDEPVILKHRPNSFLGTNLQDLLRDQGIEQVTLVGAMSQMCVDATARAAADFGFAVTVIHDACAARDVAFDGQVIPASQVHATMMGALVGTYATVISAQAYLDQDTV